MSGAASRSPAAMIGARLGMLRRLFGPANGTEDAAQLRSRQRERRIAASMLMALLAKFVSVGTALITVPLTLHYLGAERYGMWMIMSSLVAMLSFADLGIGNGLLNTIAAAHGRDDGPAMRRAVSSGLAALGAVALAVLAGFAVTYRHVDWYELFNVRSALARSEAGPAIAVFVVCFALAIPTGIVQRVQMGLQRGFLASMWQCGGSLVSLVGVLLAIWCEASLPWLVFAFLGGPLIANAVNSLVFFGVMRRDLAPRPSAASREAASEIMRTGGLFLLLQISAAVTFNSSNLLIAQLLGPAQVASYAVPERLFSLITMVASMAMAPLWPAYREAMVRGDMEWTRRTLLRSFKIAVGYAASLSIPLTFAAPWIIRHWVNGAVAPPFLLILGLGLWKILEAGAMAVAMFLNGAHVVKPQVILATLTAVVSIALQFVLLRQIGVAGAVWATIAATALCSFLPYAIILPRTLRALNAR